MKTLEETNHLVHAFVEAAVKKHQAEWYDDAVSYARFSEATIEARLTLFASLAAWDAVVREALPGLQSELEGLKALRDGGEFERKLRAARVNTAYYDCEYGPETPWTGAINDTGLARLEYLRGILGEGEA